MNPKSPAQLASAITMYQDKYRLALENHEPVDTLTYLAGVIDGLRTALGVPTQRRTLEPVELPGDETD